MDWSARYKEISERIPRSQADINEQLCATVRVAVDEAGDRSVETLRRVLRSHGLSVTRKGIKRALAQLPQ
jgi:hypothetical protein